jgi:hypothetical membrane protein
MSNIRVLFGPLGAILLALGIAVLGSLVPGYSQVHQTVSEIGEVGSPMQLPFTVMLCTVAACIVVFAWDLRDIAVTTGRSHLPAFFAALMAISAAGVGIFSFPHPLHNVFGISELIGYQAPLVLALSWRRDPNARAVVAVSWLFTLLVWIAIVLNLSAMDRSGTLWLYAKPVYGVVQRSLFAAWFGWCAVMGLMLYRDSPKPALRPA